MSYYEWKDDFHHNECESMNLARKEGTEYKCICDEIDQAIKDYHTNKILAWKKETFNVR